MTTKVSSGLVQDLANPNLFINGDFSVWQRGTSHVGITSGSSLYTADRWLCAVDSGSVDVTIGYGYEAGEQTNGCYILGSNAVGARINQRVEAAYLRAAEYKAVTLSLWVFSTVDVDLQWSPRSPVSEDDWSIVYSHGDFLLGSVPANLWTKLSFTLDLTSKVTTGFGGNITVLGTLNGGVTFSRVKLELGDVATPFVPDDPATNLAKCQRYYQKGTRYLVPAQGIGLSGQNQSVYHVFNSPMRGADSSISLTPLNYFVGGIDRGTGMTLSPLNVTLDGFRIQTNGETTATYQSAVAITYSYTIDQEL